MARLLPMLKTSRSSMTTSSLKRPSMCDTEGIDLDAADAQDKLDAAVAKVLEAVPELCGGAGTGSTGNFARRNGNAEDALDAKIRENIMGAY